MPSGLPESLPEYTVLSGLSVVVVVALELAWWRTGIFASRQYWTAMAIVGFFQVLVDGWLTKLSDPIVLYAPDQFMGVRFPWDIPVEDFAFGFSMVTLALLVWRLLGRGSLRPRAVAAQTRAEARPDARPDTRSTR